MLDGGQYKGEYGTFEKYVKQRWGWTDRRARQLMQAVKSGTIVPADLDNEGRARALGQAVSHYEEGDARAIAAEAVQVARERTPSGTAQG